jgi:putative endonuclease
VSNLLKRLFNWWRANPEASQNIRLGRLGEDAARKYLSAGGMQFLTGNFRTPRGEIDLIFRDRSCLVFVEVKTRSEGTRTRPALAVDLRKRQRISRAAETYLRRIDAARPVWRFDVVEVLLKEEKVSQIQHLKNVFELHPRGHGRGRGHGTSG